MACIAFTCLAAVCCRCCGDTFHLDLSKWAFEKIANTGDGVIGIYYKQVACPGGSSEFKSHTDCKNAGCSGSPPSSSDAATTASSSSSSSSSSPSPAGWDSSNSPSPNSDSQGSSWSPPGSPPSVPSPASPFSFSSPQRGLALLQVPRPAGTPPTRWRICSSKECLCRG